VIREWREGKGDEVAEKQSEWRGRREGK